MNRPPSGNSSKMKSSRPSLSGFKSGFMSASKQIRGTVQNVAQSVAVVQANRASDGPKGSFLGQIKDQIVHDRSKRREDEERGTQRLALFPGWAVRRFEMGDQSTGDVRHFRIDVFVSGYAFMMRPPDRATRSQKAFLGIAKAFASLPKLPPSAGLFREDSLGLGIPLSRSTEDLLKMTPLPPRPDEMTPDREAQVLKSHELSTEPLEPPRPNFLSEPTAIPPPDVSKREQEKRRSTGGSFYNHRNSSSASVSSTASATSQTASFAGLDASEILRLHENFHNRLQPFWARMVTSGTVRISLYTMNIHTGAVDRHLAPIAFAEVPIASDTGYFGNLFSIPFQTIGEHPGGAQLAFGDHGIEQRLTAIAEYIAPPPLPPRPGGLPQDASQEANAYAPSVQSQLHSLPPPTAQIEFSLTDARVRLISDIDDTIKVSSILHGVRAVFRNVFVRQLEELACPGMPEWYRQLSLQGVKFHYVNSSESLDILRGSLKLKYYGGKSLFKGLWEPAGERKRAGVVEIMDYFPETKFFLVGDSGEQDMELYTSLVKEFHQAGRQQVLGVFIRDVNPEPNRNSSLGFPPLPTPPRSLSPSRTSFAGSSSDTPYGELDSGTFLSVSSTTTAPKTLSVITESPAPYSREDPMTYAGQRSSASGSGASSDLDRNTTIKAPPQRRNLPPPLPSRPSSAAVPQASYGDIAHPPSAVIRDVPHAPPRHQSSTDSTVSETTIAAAMASADASTPSLTKKRAEFKIRLAKARDGMPPDVPFIVFVHPEECYDTANRILEGLGMGNAKR